MWVRETKVSNQINDETSRWTIAFVIWVVWRDFQCVECGVHFATMSCVFSVVEINEKRWEAKKQKYLEKTISEKLAIDSVAEAVSL